jgi:hypothetical protein
MKVLDSAELHPDLEDYVDGETLYHPLLSHHSIREPHGVEMANKIYEGKSRQIAEAIQSQDWTLFVFLHERPYRVDALIELINEFGVSGKDLWPVVGEVWSDTESVRFEGDAWRTIWCTNCPDREWAMAREEFERLNMVPEQLEIWRGVNHEDAVRSLSWTLDRDVAVWFARRFAAVHDPVLLARGWVSKRNVLAYLTGRSEAEIVVLPENVREIEVFRLESTDPILENDDAHA